MANDPLEGLAYYNRRAPGMQNRRAPIGAMTRRATQPFAGWQYGAYNAPLAADYGQAQPAAPATQTYANYVKPADASHYTDPVRPWQQPAPEPYAPDLNIKPPEPQPYEQPVTPRPQAPTASASPRYVPQAPLMGRRNRY